MAAADKVERLMNLVAALLEAQRPLARDELRSRIPGYPAGAVAFRRTFERDKQTLRDMGVPVTVAEIPGTDPPVDGYRILRAQYELRDPGLEPDELAAVHLAAEAVRVDGVEGTGALWKLGGLAAEAGSPPAEVASLPADPNLVTAFAAIGERRTVTLRYRDTTRTVDPYRLDFARGRWYLTGFDHLRADERHFRLDRIVGIIEAGDPGAFERPAAEVPGVRIAPWQLGEGEPIVARILVDADQAASAQATAGDAATRVGERPDGSVVLELAVTNLDGFRSFVLGFLDHAEVLAPPELRAELVAWLEPLAGAGPP